jgi:NAD(P)-dependent dehydrogenase (short-subunit alcohol dehydrogenase family)
MRKTIIVTGGASGIGEAIVTRLLDSCNVVVVDKQVSRHSHPAMLFIQADVTVETDVARIYDRTVGHFQAADVLVNNAGVSDKCPLRQTSLQIWNKALNNNVTGAFLMGREFANRFRHGQADLGRIINIASVSGLVGMPGYSAYNVSKAGLIQLTKTMALELAPSIMSCAICPGYVLTPMQASEYSLDELEACADGNPLKRLARPREVAELIDFLISGRNDYFNGSIIVMDGGETAGGLASR